MARHADPLTSAEIDVLTLQASWLANLSHALMSEFLVPRLAPEASVVLTPRESEVLCWTGEGKTACEIGQILNISERTVNFHVNNVLLKLNATNKVQAVVKAVAMGSSLLIDADAGAGDEPLGAARMPQGTSAETGGLRRAARVV